MQIGELARRAGTTAKALRYYEAIGLLAAESRTPSGYRQYGADALDR
ncbi:MAG TPA: MerR family DNA-binding transcriptional regulator, partial [Actinomycetota bacterium]|nr:MerR family DNA-binding transcriptional regulator [Actinomycetota bacterium]